MNQDIKNVVGVSIIASIISALIIFLILPLISTELKSIISALEFTDANILVGYLGILIIICITELLFILFLRSQFKKLFSYIIICFIYSILFLSIISFVYIGINAPHLIYGINSFKIVLHLFTYPSILAIFFGSIEIYWTLTILLFIILFNIFYIMKSKKEIVIIEKVKISKFQKK